MRNALIVGIDYYEFGNQLYGCVNDARSVQSVLSTHGDGMTENFECKLLISGSSSERVNRNTLKNQIRKLFRNKDDICLFYFAGHGHIEETGGYLLTSDSQNGNDGVPLSEILDLANNSPSLHKVIILDSCNSGIAGNATIFKNLAVLADGVTILTSSTEEQYSEESLGSGLFTSLLVDALRGGAASLTGKITPGSVYAYIDQSLAWDDQRPVFKTNVSRFISLRNFRPSIPIETLRQIVSLFPTPYYQFPLDPTFEPDMKGRDKGMPRPIQANTEKFAILQKYNRVNLLVPVDAPHMWHAAMESKSCKLTVLGQHYWKLVKNERI